MPRREIRKEKVIEYYLQSMGHISASCAAANISRHTFYTWMEKDPDFKQSIEEAEESFKDFVESKFYEKVKSGDWTAIRYYLEAKAKERGYAPEQQQVQHTGDIKLEIVKRTIGPSA